MTTWEDSGTFTVNPWSDSGSFTVSPYSSDSATLEVYDEDAEFSGYGSHQYGGSQYGSTADYVITSSIRGELNAESDITLGVEKAEFTNIAGTIESRADKTAELTKTTAITGQVGAFSEKQLDLTQETYLDLESNSAAQIEGELSVFEAVEFSLDMSAAAELDNSLAKKTFLEGESDSDAQIEAGLTNEKYLDMQSDSAATQTGEITRKNLVEGNLNSSSTLSNTITFDRDVIISGDLNSSSTNKLSLKTSLDTSGYQKFAIDRMHSVARENALEFVSRIKDPVDRVKDDFLYMDAPRPKSQEFGGYPYIILEEYTLNDTSNSVNGLNTDYDIDIEIHVVGTRDSFEDIKNFDSINDQITALVKGPKSIILNQGAEIGNLQFLRQNRLPGIEQNDQPVIRQEYEIRGKLHINSNR